MLAKVTDGTAPRVERDGDEIALYAFDEGAPHGFVLRDTEASTVAMRLLAAVAAGETAVLHRAQSLEIDIGETAPEPIVRLTFTIDGAPVAVEINPTQFAELGAAVAAISREIDRAQRPRKDR